MIFTIWISKILFINEIFCSIEKTKFSKKKVKFSHIVFLESDFWKKIIISKFWSIVKTQQKTCVFADFKLATYGVFGVHFNQKNEIIKILHPISILTYGDFDNILKTFLSFSFNQMSYIVCFWGAFRQKKWKWGIFPSKLSSYIWRFSHILQQKLFFCHSLRIDTYGDFDIILSKHWIMNIKYIRYVYSCVTSVLQRWFFSRCETCAFHHFLQQRSTSVNNPPMHGLFSVA